MNRLGLLFGIALVALGLLIVGKTRPQTAQVDYGSAPDFSLTDSSGRALGLEALRGKVWIADFIFTSCAGTCPMMSGQMRKLQDSLPHDIRLVSFSVDPARDTPAVLAHYATQLGADPNRWVFLTGDRQQVYDVSVKGFKLALDDGKGSETEPIMHSSRFVLIDRAGQIRGYYSGTEDADLTRLSEDAKKLL